LGRKSKLTHAKLVGFRRYALIINLILAAVLTTPEIVTQVLLFIPMQMAYEIGVRFLWYREREHFKEVA
jgi:sec-independent protein translocase protein TatC